MATLEVPKIRMVSLGEEPPSKKSPGRETTGEGDARAVSGCDCDCDQTPCPCQCQCDCDQTPCPCQCQCDCDQTPCPCQCQCDCDQTPSSSATYEMKSSMKKSGGGPGTFFKVAADGMKP